MRIANESGSGEFEGQYVANSVFTDKVYTTKDDAGDVLAAGWPGREPEEERASRGQVLKRLTIRFQCRNRPSRGHSLRAEPKCYGPSLRLHALRLERRRASGRPSPRSRRTSHRPQGCPP